MEIMIVEDDRTIHFGLREHLSAKGYELVSAYTFSEGFQMIDSSIDLYILDISLPDGSGLDLLTHIRSVSENPVIFLSAHDDEHTINRGFDGGGDDYITKPFRLNELDRRILSIQKRSNIMRIGDLSIDIKRGKVFIGSDELVLSVIEYQLLLELANQSPTIVSRDVLIQKVWVEAPYNTLSVNIRRLRTKLGDAVTIHSVVNEGYGISQ